jgi:hypothetical protein
MFGVATRPPSGDTPAILADDFIHAIGAGDADMQVWSLLNVHVVAQLNFLCRCRSDSQLHAVILTCMHVLCLTRLSTDVFILD